ncbi:unnamed protein product [Pseudo-nitzschia multistriata]|uniref:Elongin-C n=1 Tax=Pseudo-nitzschia multistriata TaxID=183589 RepID=A0A448ZHA1_9STRA|nr:unnamed protein product [Pseudo-nitzschia multistriata]
MNKMRTHEKKFENYDSNKENNFVPNMADEDSKEQQHVYVKLVSAEGHETFVDRAIAMGASATIRTMLEGQFREAQDNVIRFPNITTAILEQVVRYMQFKAKYTNSSSRIPEFTIEPEYALELLIASKYLDC